MLPAWNGWIHRQFERRTYRSGNRASGEIYLSEEICVLEKEEKTWNRVRSQCTAAKGITGKGIKKLDLEWWHHKKELSRNYVKRPWGT